MSMVYYSAELLTTFAEGLLLFWMLTTFCGKRFTGHKHRLLFLACTMVYTVLVLLLNGVQLFSLATVIIGGIFASLVSLLLTKKSLFYTLLISAEYILFIITIEFVINLLVGFFSRKPSLPQEIVNEIGTNRLFYIISTKCITTLIFFLIKKFIPNPENIPLKMLIVSFAVLAMACVYNFYIYSSVVSQSVVSMQLLLVFSWAFVIISVFAVQKLIKNNQEKKEKENEYDTLASVNEIMVESYRKLEAVYAENAKTVHDFKHHVSALQHLADGNSLDEMQNYLHSLNHSIKRSAPVVITKVEIIDAVLYSKLSKMRDKDIKFDMNIHYPPDINILHTDFCVILSNLLDNAIEYVEQIQLEKRYVSIAINQVNSMLMIKIINALDNTVSVPENLETSKADKKSHGWGVKSVRSTARKYNGTLEYIQRDYEIEAFVLLNVNKIDTKTQN